MKHAAMIFAAALAATPAFAADADQSADLGYRIYVGGLPLANLDMALALTPDGYAASGAFTMTAFIKLFFDSDARAEATGRWRDGEAKPSAFSFWLREGDKERVARIDFAQNGEPAAVVSDPPFPQRPDDLPFSYAQGAIDPASAVALLSSPRESMCDLHVSAFDGRKLHRLTLTPNSQENDVAWCDGVYERVAGLRKDLATPEVSSYPFTARLRRRADGMIIPEAFTADTGFGTAAVRLKRGG